MRFKVAEIERVDVMLVEIKEVKMSVVLHSLLNTIFVIKPEVCAKAIKEYYVDDPGAAESQLDIVVYLTTKYGELVTGIPHTQEVYEA